MSKPKMEPRELWRKDTDGLRPVKVMGTGYPENDSDGVPIYENSHFVYLADAWTAVMEERAAHVSLAGRSVSECVRELAKAEREAGKAAMLFAQAKDNHDRWKRENG